MVKGITTPIIKSRKEWDSTVVDLKELKVIDKNSEYSLLYSKYSPGLMMAYRDYITVRKIVREKKRIYIASKSVKPTDKQFQIEDKDTVRGEIYFSCHCIEILDTSKCKDTFISHMNLNGWIPTGAYNKLSSDQVLVPVKVSNLIKKHKQ